MFRFFDASTSDFSSLLDSKRAALIELYNALFKNGGTIREKFSTLHCSTALMNPVFHDYDDILDHPEQLFTELKDVKDIFFAAAPRNISVSTTKVKGEFTIIPSHPRDDELSPISRSVSHRSSFESYELVSSEDALDPANEFSQRVIFLFQESPDYVWIQLHGYQKTKGHKFPKEFEEVVQNLRGAIKAAKKNGVHKFDHFDPETILTRFTDNLMNLLPKEIEIQEIISAIELLRAISNLIARLDELITHQDDPNSFLEVFNIYQKTVSFYSEKIKKIPNIISKQLCEIEQIAEEVITIIGTELSPSASGASSFLPSSSSNASVPY